MTDQQITIREQRQGELGKIIMRAIAQYADDNVDAIPKLEDRDVFLALMNVIVNLLARTSEHNCDNALRFFDPVVAQEVKREIERCSLHYARPQGAA
jgi:hypothetical protein